MSARSSGPPARVRMPRELFDHLHQAAAQERLAAGKSDFGDAETDEEPDEAQIFVDPQLGILRAHFTCAAIDAFVIAPVGDGDAQVVDHAAMAVGEPPGRVRSRCDWGSRCHFYLLRLYRFGKVCRHDRNESRRRGLILNAEKSLKPSLKRLKPPHISGFAARDPEGTPIRALSKLRVFTNRSRRKGRPVSRRPAYLVKIG